MGDAHNKLILSRNLREHVSGSGKNAAEICEALGISQSTFSDWITGKAYPRIDKLQMLADFFGVKKSDLVEEHTDSNKYYLDSEVGRMVQDLFDDPDRRALFKASRRLSKEDIVTVRTLIERLARDKEDE